LSLEDKKLQAYLMTVSYDGTDFFGWYCPQNRSIKTCLQDGLGLPLQNFLVASRTDRGVHAEDQKVYFTLDSSFVPLLPDLSTLNHRLAADIRVLSLESCPLDFHPSLEAKSKEYHYRFHKGDKPPSIERFSLSIQPIDLSKIESSLFLFLGKKDFRIFENAQSRRENRICHIESLKFDQIADDSFVMKIRADRFLYKMCRKIAGTLLYIGYGKLSLTSLKRGFEKFCPQACGPTLSSKGLILKKINYDRDLTLPV
jgi:tRNA pseudouridine38-40 synthase